MYNSTEMISLNENGCYCLTLETVNTVDIFTKPVYKQIIVHSLNHFIDTRGLIVYGWCLLSNRLYMICQAQNHNLLTDIRKAFKNFTSEKILESLNSDPDERKHWLLSQIKNNHAAASNNYTTCWQSIKELIAIDMRKPDVMAAQLELIHNIPVKDRIVQYGSDYLYSSAKDYEGLNGLVKVTKLMPVEQALNAIENTKSSFKQNYNRQ